MAAILFRSALSLSFAAALVSGMACSHSSVIGHADRCRIVYAHDAGSDILQGAGGEIVLAAEPRVEGGAAAAARYFAKPLPLEMVTPRRSATTRPKLLDVDKYQGRDTAGRSWFLRMGGMPMRVTAVGGDGAREWTLRSKRSLWKTVPTARPQWPYVGGNLLHTGDAAWVTGPDCLYRIRGKEPEMVPFLSPALQQSFSDNEAWEDQLYSRGEELWMVRQGRYDLASAILRVNTKAEGFEGLVERAVTVMGLLKNEHCTALIFHAGETYALTEEQVGQVLPEIYRPKRIVRVGTASVPATAPASTQSAASTKLGTYAAARLVFVDRAGKQYVQPWKEGKPLSCLLVIDERSITEVVLPTPHLVLDVQGEDGRIYGHDSAMLYSMEPGGGNVKLLAFLGSLANRPLRVAAQQGKYLCVALKTKQWYRDVEIPMWLSLQEPSDLPPLAGSRLASDIAVPSRQEYHFPVALGPGGKLWFLQYRGPDKSPWESVQDSVSKQWSRIWKEPDPAPVLTVGVAANGRIEQSVSAPVTLREASVWPLSATAAVVANLGFADPRGPTLLVHGQQVQHAASLEALVAECANLLREYMPDGSAFYAGSSHDLWLARVGDAFYVAATVPGNDGGSHEFSGVFEQGWLQRQSSAAGRNDYAPYLNRVLALDTDSRQVLAFRNRWQDVRWMSLIRGEGELLDSGPSAWAWCWKDQTAKPRLEHGWFLTSSARDHYLKVKPDRVEDAFRAGSPAPEVYAEYEGEDFAAIRSWRKGEWRERDVSPHGAAIFHDNAGNDWFLRLREAEVISPKGESELLPLGAGLPPFYRLAPADDGSVWIASQHTLTQYARLEDSSGKFAWQPRRTLALPAMGLGFDGPWITGDDLYYLSGRSLYHIKLSALQQPASP